MTNECGFLLIPYFHVSQHFLLDIKYFDVFLNVLLKIYLPEIKFLLSWEDSITSNLCSGKFVNAKVCFSSLVVQ